jgi:hypothetical protein
MYILILILLLCKFLIVNSSYNKKKMLVKRPSDNNLYLSSQSENISLRKSPKKKFKTNEKILYSRVLIERQVKIDLFEIKTNILFYVINNILLYESLSYEDKILIDFCISLYY